MRPYRQLGGPLRLGFEAPADCGALSCSLFLKLKCLDPALVLIVTIISYLTCCRERMGVEQFNIPRARPTTAKGKRRAGGEDTDGFPDRKVIGIEGKWYDVTDFVSVHPGGPIIEHFIGKDATTVFRANGHGDYILKHRKQVGSYDYIPRHPADADFDQLRRTLKEKGFFTTDWAFYGQKVLFCVALLVACFVCVTQFRQWYVHYIGAVFLELFWQQCGFIMHDIMHLQIFRNRKQDDAGGVVIGTFCLGVSAHWWQDEHIVHHALTNTVNVANRFADPQMWESVWAQNPKLFPVFKGVLQNYLIKIQHLTFVPMVAIFGRAVIVVESYGAERRWCEWLAILGHWIWMSYLLSFLPTWREVIIFYFIASTLEGVLHFQLILSHYCKLFMNEDELHESSWNIFQVLSNMNIDCPLWLDWYWGGLNFHIEHHLFPKMARNRLREASPYVRQVCEKHNIDYDSVGFAEGLCKTLTHLKLTGKHYSLDPR